MNLAIDENVIAVANDISRILRSENPVCPQATDICRLASVELLEQAINSNRVLIDMGDKVLSYYRRKASMSGQPGSGDAFLMALYQQSYDPERVIRVEVPDEEGCGLPVDFVRCGFDIDDMVYIALARSSPPAELINAVDSDYAIFSHAIQELGVTVREIC